MNSPLLDDESIYHTCITLFSIGISAVTVIKAKNVAHVIQSVIHKTQQLNIQSSGLELMKLLHLVGSVDPTNIFFRMTCLLPTY